MRVDNGYILSFGRDTQTFQTLHYKHIYLQIDGLLFIPT